MFISNKQPEDSFNKVVSLFIYCQFFRLFLSSGLFACIYVNYIFCLTHPNNRPIFRIKLFLQRLFLKSAKLNVMITFGIMGSG